jgi:hypothetical protein
MRKKILILLFITSTVQAGNLFDTISNTVDSGANWVVETTKKSIHPYAPYYMTKAAAIFLGWSSAKLLEDAATTPGIRLSSRLLIGTYAFAQMVASANTWISAR